MAINTRELERRIETARAAAKEFSRRIRSEWGARVMSVRLYGSFARGDAAPESDVDIVILVKRRHPRDRDRASDLAFRIGALKHEIVLMPMVFSKNVRRYLKSLACEFRHGRLPDTRGDRPDAQNGINVVAEPGSSLINAFSVERGNTI